MGSAGPPGTKFVSVGELSLSIFPGRIIIIMEVLATRIVNDRDAADGTAIICSKNKHTDSFHATRGGVGLTGITLMAAIALKSVKSTYMHETIIKVRCLRKPLHF
jgi:hypothetical protein